MTEFDKEQFLQDIHTIPSWVKNGDDLLNFCKHIQYRLFQYQSIARWYGRNTSLTDEKDMELNNLIHQYNEAYQNDISQFQPFSKMFNKKVQSETVN